MPGGGRGSGSIHPEEGYSSWWNESGQSENEWTNAGQWFGNADIGTQPYIGNDTNPFEYAKYLNDLERQATKEANEQALANARETNAFNALEAEKIVLGNITKIRALWPLNRLKRPPIVNGKK